MIGRALCLLEHLRRASSGVAMIEFALSFPLLLVLGLCGAEVSNMALVQMRVSQLALNVADNASRVGETSVLAERKIYESDINDLLLGASIQSGGLRFFENGRVIVSSLEHNPSNPGEQYIHWQRCKGKKTWGSHYGHTGDIMAGIGPTGQQVSAPDNGAVIFVEVAFDYQPIVPVPFFSPTTITSTASFVVRDDRDLSQIYQRDPGDPDEVSDCNAYTSFPAITI